MTFNRLTFKLPTGIIDSYLNTEYQGAFTLDGQDGVLIFRVAPEDYNAANPVQKNISRGVILPIVDRTINYYQIEATTKDKRDIYTHVLKDLIAVGGNLSSYGLNNQVHCQEPLIVLQDYIELDNQSDRLRGFALRVGILNVESLKGGFRNESGGVNYNQGCRIIFTQSHSLTPPTPPNFVYSLTSHAII